VRLQPDRWNVGLSPMNILITAASRRVPLVLAFRNALGSLGMPGRVVVTDVNPLSMLRPCAAMPTRACVHRNSRSTPATVASRSSSRTASGV
jgi:hypothetical protein